MRFRPSVTAAGAAVITALALAACGGSATPTANSGGRVVTVVRTQTVTVPSSRSTTETGPLTNTTATKTSTNPQSLGNQCTASDLTPSYLGSNGAAGTIVLGFALKNTGTSTCRTYGWPGVEFLSSSGGALPTGATRTSGDVVGSTPAVVLTLTPGDTASFRIVTSDMGPGGAACPTASALQIYAPNDTATMKVSVPGIAACGKATVSPMQPGLTAFSGQGGGGQAGGAQAGGGQAGGGQAGVGSGGSGGSGVSGG